jgi:hypothetical protein
MKDVQRGGSSIRVDGEDDEGLVKMSDTSAMCTEISGEIIEI